MNEMCQVELGVVASLRSVFCSARRLLTKDLHGYILSQMKHLRFEALRKVPDVWNTLRETDYAADTTPELSRKGSPS